MSNPFFSRASAAWANTSHREMAAWASLVVTVFVYVPYFSWAFRRFAEGQLTASAVLGALIGAVITQVVFLIVIHIALALALKEEPKDERAVFIDARAALTAYNLLSFVVIVVAIGIVATGLVSAGPMETLLDPILISQVLLFVCILAEVARYLVQAVSYRRGS